MHSHRLVEGYLKFLRRNKELMDEQRYYRREYVKIMQDEGNNENEFTSLIKSATQDELDSLLLTTIETRDESYREFTRGKRSFLVEIFRLYGSIFSLGADRNLVESLLSRCSEEGIRKAILSPLIIEYEWSLASLKQNYDTHAGRTDRNVNQFNGYPGIVYLLQSGVFPPLLMDKIIKETDPFLLNVALNKFSSDIKGISGVFKRFLLGNSVAADFASSQIPQNALFYIDKDRWDFCRDILKFMGSPASNLKKRYPERISFYRELINCFKSQVNNFKDSENISYSHTILGLSTVKNTIKYNELLVRFGEFKRLFDDVIKSALASKLSSKDLDELYFLQGQFLFLFDKTEAYYAWNNIKNFDIFNPDQHLLMSEFYLHLAKPERLTVTEDESHARGVVHARLAMEGGSETALDFYNIHLVHANNPDEKIDITTDNNIIQRKYFQFLLMHFSKRSDEFFTEFASQAKIGLFHPTKDITVFENLLELIPKVKNDQSDENLKNLHIAILNLLQNNKIIGKKIMESILNRMDYWVVEFIRSKFPISRLIQHTVEAAVDMSFDTIQELKPDLQIKIYSLLLSLPSASEQELNKMSREHKMNDEIKPLIDLLLHPFPQNRSNGDENAFASEILKGRDPVTPEEKEASQTGVYKGNVYYFENGFGSKVLSEPQGLLGLTSRISETISKDKIQFVVRNLLSQKIDNLLDAENSLSLEEKRPQLPSQ